MNQVPTNIALFNVITLRILDRLYDAFPKPIDVTPGTIGIEITEKEDGDGAWNAMEVADHTLRWLRTEGFLTYANKTHDGKFTNVQLSLKGLTVLGSVPASIKPEEPVEPLHKRVKRVLESSAEGAIADAAKAIIQQIFGAILSGAGAQAL
jgi:hypothetical protein